MSANRKQPAPAIPTPKGVRVSSVRVEFSQESDTCESQGLGQSLVIKTEDGGYGAFPILSTRRWALEYNEIDQFADLIRSVLAMVPDEAPIGGKAP